MGWNHQAVNIDFWKPILYSAYPIFEWQELLETVAPPTAVPLAKMCGCLVHGQQGGPSVTRWCPVVLQKKVCLSPDFQTWNILVLK